MTEKRISIVSRIPDLKYYVRWETDDSDPLTTAWTSYVPDKNWQNSETHRWLEKIRLSGHVDLYIAYNHLEDDNDVLQVSFPVKNCKLIMFTRAIYHSYYQVLSLGKIKLHLFTVFGNKASVLKLYNRLPIYCTFFQGYVAYEIIFFLFLCLLH